MSKVITEQSILEFREKLVLDEKSDCTVKKYVRDVEAFYRFIGAEQVSKEKVIAYKNLLITRYAPASVNSMLAAINRFLKEQGWYDCTVKAVKIQGPIFRPKERELTKEEYYRLLRAAKKKHNMRLYLLMQTICSTGIRVSELPYITVEAVRQGMATVSLKGKTRQVLIPSSMICALSEYIRVNKIRRGSVFVTKNGSPLDRSNILHEMKALCSEAGVEKSKVFPHNLRHLFACIYYKAEKDITHLADILGHSSINTTRIYTNTSGTDQQLKLDSLGLVLEQNITPHNFNYAVRHSRISTTAQGKL